MTTPPSLTYGLRELVWSLESEVAVVSNLCRRIDQDVTRLNDLRGQLASRLRRLDELVAATEDDDLYTFLVARCAAPLPTVEEQFPARLYA